MIDDIFDFVEEGVGDESGADTAPSSTSDDVDWLIDTTLHVTEIAQSVHGMQSGGISPLELMRFLAMIDNSYFTEPESRSSSIEEYYADHVLDFFI